MMPELTVKDGKAFCKECSRTVSVNGKPGEQGIIGQLCHVLIDDKGHVVGERATDDAPWREAA